MAASLAAAAADAPEVDADAGLSSLEAARRLVVYGPKRARGAGRDVVAARAPRPADDPLALLLWGAAVLASVGQLVVASRWSS